MNSTHRVRILLVNDDQTELDSIIRRLKQECADTIEAVAFGPKQAGCAEVGRVLLDMLLGERTCTVPLNTVDVLFVDFAMPGLNGVELLRWLNQHKPKYRIPVVLMTKHDEEMIREAVTAVEMGARGYVFHSSIYFKEIELAAHRVFLERQREEWSQSLVELSSRLPEATGEEEICRLLPTVLAAHTPHLIVFVRRISRREGKAGYELLAASDTVPPDILDGLQFIPQGRFPILDAAAQSQVKRYDSIEDAADFDAWEDSAVCRRLGLNRCLALWVSGPKGEPPFGTVCMYRKPTEAPFGATEERYASLMISAIAFTLATFREQQKGLAYTQFAREFASYEREDDLYQGLVRHFHKQIHRAPEHTQDFKVTFKSLRPGTDKLICQPGHHVGAPRLDPLWSPSIYRDASISSYVARTNDARLVSDFQEVKDYFPMNPLMRSELCLPVSRSLSGQDTVFGVINLESTTPGWYTQKHLEYALALCRLAGHYVDRLRAARFLEDVLKIVTLRAPVEKRIRASLDLIRTLAGYHLLLFVLKGKDDRWIVADADGPPEVDIAEFRAEAEQRLNSELPMLLKEALAGTGAIYYESDLQASKNSRGWTPNFIIEQGREFRSQAVFVLRAEGVVVGALSLDFVTAYPLTAGTRDLLAYFTHWLAVMFVHTEHYESLSERVQRLSMAVSQGAIMAQVYHKAVAELHTLENLANNLRSETSLPGNHPALKTVALLEQGLEQLRWLPTRVKSIYLKPSIKAVDTAAVCKKVRDQLRRKASKLRVDVKVFRAMPSVECDEDILEMCLYQLLDNALDACEKSVAPKVQCVADVASSGMVEIKVIDNGDNATTPKNVSEPGRSTKSKGMGWGLYIVNLRAGDMGGELHMRRRKIGTEAILRLPVANALRMANDG